MKPYYSEAGIEIYHGDCREVLPSLAAHSIGAVVTDPPYGTAVASDGYGRRHIHHGQQHIAGDDDLNAMSFAVNESRRLLVPDGWLVVFCSPKMHSKATAVCEGAEFEIRGEVIWDKLRPGLGAGIRYQHETVLLCHLGQAQGRSSMFSVLRSLGCAGGHPHEKPVDVMTQLIRYASRSGELVLDPFCGSGATLVAAKLMGHAAIGCEIGERWCEIAANRLAQGVLNFTGGAA
jgi:site-specific DNA-methyltransferase (adenine-specific)